VASDSRAAQRRLLVLGAGAAQLGLLRAARERDLFVIAADRDPSAPGFRYADRRAIVSAEDEPGIERLAEAERVDGLIAPGLDWPVSVAARVAERLALPHPIDSVTSVLATSKQRQRERFRDAGVPQPRFELVRTVEEGLGAANAVGYPCVVKAPDRQGQRGLALVSEPADVAGAVTAAIEASRSGLALLEEYAPGRELTVNAFSVGGRFVPLTVTDRRIADPPAFGVALAHVWPSALDPATVEQGVGAAAAATSALGIEEGPTYTQVLASPAGPRVVELAARLGGGHDAELCLATLGVDLNGLALAAALGDDIAASELEPDPRAGGGVVRFLVAPPGPLASVDGIDDALGEDGVVDVHVYRRPGHVFAPLRRGADRAGAVIAVGDSREQALERADAAADMIRFEIADAEALV
jgi:biotin carboxylase